MVDALADLIRASCRRLESDLSGEFGLLDKLDGRISDGEWAHHDTVQARYLAVSEGILLHMASEIRKRREQLIANLPQAAE